MCCVDCTRESTLLDIYFRGAVDCLVELQLDFDCNVLIALTILAEATSLSAFFVGKTSSKQVLKDGF